MKSVTLLVFLSLFAACNDASKGNRPLINASTGAQVSSNATIRSQLHRVRATEILSTTQETSAAESLPVGYDNIPNIFEADDGFGTDSRSVVHATHSGNSCGIGTQFATIKDRIANCESLNLGQASWKGSANGNSGEGNWTLVARNVDGKEIWLDETTNYVWSDVVAEATGWCDASGNTQGLADGGVVDCHVLGTRSLCANSALPGIPESQVSWRLPTRGDFLQADLDGARFVLRNVSTMSFWSATVNGTNRDEAWAILQSTGALSSVSRAEGRAVRCIGRRLN